MVIDVNMKGRSYSAFGTYEDGTITVHKGSTIGSPRKAGFKKSKQAYLYRENPAYVKDNTVRKDIQFASPSTAAQFVSGGSRNGYDTWFVKKGYSLGNYLEEKGIRISKKRVKEKKDD